ncbi:hypothetical protein LHP98_05350 [Rhodobacter sp. Har01]|uniref:hypothetical protein n=1 Tax=Rhodobacter sp. Har01 TaxID=2883999 RepID=UPI001D07BA4A|nr:hypothetical protein [Rhodobacter sp. Har01]MCB6177555.1 hypothetical protein [Rhodobacter sp. Har01]
MRRQMRAILAGLVLVAGLAGLFYLVWQTGKAGPSAFLQGLPGPQEEAAYCLAVAERIGELARRGSDPRLDRFLDEQVEFWRGRAGNAFGAGRAALARATANPSEPEDRALFLGLQDCAWRAMAFYGQHFPSMEADGL